MKRLAIALILVATRVATADTSAWQGFQTLGVPDEAVSLLVGVTIEGLRQGELVDDVELDDTSARCGVDVACHCAGARKRGARFAAYGSLGKLSDLWTVELTLVDTHACTVEGAVYMSEAISD